VGGEPCLDIVSARHAFDGAHYYFRFQRYGATLGWKVKAGFGADFTRHAATMLPGQGPHKKTFDHAVGNRPTIPAPGVGRLPGR
jgi:hypothetical protein